MNKIENVHEQIYAIMSRTIKSWHSYMPAYAHMQQVSHICALLAVKRSENPELAAIAGLLHDIAYVVCYENKRQKSRYNNELIFDINKITHSDASAVIAEKILTENNILTQEECGIICRAITRHNKGNPDNTDTTFDEILKDADVFAHGLTSVSSLSANFRGSRWDKICFELGMESCRKINDDGI